MNTKLAPRPANVDQAWQFRLELTDPRGAVVATHAVEPASFRRAVYAAHFEGFRGGRFARYSPDLDVARIEPRFSDTAEHPARTSGFRVVAATAEGVEQAIDCGVGYFSSLATSVRGRLVREGQLPAETPLTYQLAAYLGDPPQRRNRSAIELAPAVMQVPLRDGSLPATPTQSWDAPDAADLPVFIARSVVEESVDASRAAADREIGGLLLGNLRSGGENGLFLEITCLVSCEGTTESSATSVTFTPRSFAKAKELIMLRAGGGPAESICGWMHSHPFRTCAECPLPTPSECVDKILSYSQDDIHWMESTADQPYMVGLLAGIEQKLADVLLHPPVRLYGWRRGEIHARGFHVVNDK